MSAGSFATANGEMAFSAGLPYGVVRLLAGSLGLILVVVAGAELFSRQQPHRDGFGEPCWAWVSRPKHFAATNRKYRR